MKIIQSIAEIRAISQELKLRQKSIGFVPTMGALHEGHLSLIEESKKSCDVTVCSIFVNKEQFNNAQDFNNYPINTGADSALLEEYGCDYLFMPSHDEIYTEIPTLKFNFGRLENIMEGKYRPGHFSGVALIVSKLFHFVSPNKAFFGQKDYQQLTIIKQLVKDLSFNIDIISCETKRAENGLALSSRNLLLTEGEIEVASKIYESLQLVKSWLNSKTSDQIKKDISGFYEETALELEYLEIVNAETLEPIIAYQADVKVAICVAAYLGNVRLIDNIVV